MLCQWHLVHPEMYYANGSWYILHMSPSMAKHCLKWSILNTLSPWSLSSSRSLELQTDRAVNCWRSPQFSDDFVDGRAGDAFIRIAWYRRNSNRTFALLKSLQRSQTVLWWANRSNVVCSCDVHDSPR